MKIYNQEKTQELNYDDLDFRKGYLTADKIFVAHHEAVEAKAAVYQDRVVEHESGGTSIYKDLVTPAVEAKEAWDEYEDIQVYVPYTEEQLKERLRARRVQLLDSFDKWEKAVLRGRETDDDAVMQWYQKLLDLDDSAFENIPERVRYYA